MITGYVGLPGSGKSYTMMRNYLTWYRYQKYIPTLYSNMTGLCVPGARYIHDVDQLSHVTNCHVLLDEAGNCLSSRNWQNMSRSVLMELQQVRKDGINLWWTTPNENRVDVVLREITFQIVRCSKVGPLFLSVVEDTDKKQVAHRTWMYNDPKFYFLYDTFGKIGSVGGTAGVGAASTVERRIRKRFAAEEASRNRRAAPRPPLLYSHLRGRLYMRKDTREAIQYLAQADRLSSGPDWYSDVRQELARRSWLKKFALDPDDMPIDCTPDNCWEPGYSPTEVIHRIELDQMKIALATLAAYGSSEKLNQAKQALLDDAKLTVHRLQHISPDEVGF